MARFALLVGRNGPVTEKLDNLQFVHRDVERLADAFASAPANYEHVEVIETGCTASECLDKFDMLASATSYNDLLLFFFSGHGCVIRQQLFLIWPDTVLGRATSTALPVSQLKFIFATARANAKLMILDCCRSGVAAGSVFEKGVYAEFSETLVDATRDGVNAIVAACSRNATTRELAEFESGYLSHLLVSAISSQLAEADVDKDGLLSLNDFITWSADQTRIYNQAHNLTDPLEAPEVHGDIKGPLYLTSQQLKRNDTTPIAGVIEQYKRVLSVTDLSDRETLHLARVANFQRFVEMLRIFAPDGSIAMARTIAFEHASILGMPDDVFEAEFEAFAAKSRFDSSSTLCIPAKQCVRKAMAVLTSTSATGAGYELHTESIHGSFFTHYLLQGLRGTAANSQGFVTVRDLLESIKRQMRLHPDLRQSPDLYERNEGGEILLTGRHLQFNRSEKRAALLVGTNTFLNSSIPPLRYAERDITEVARVLTDKGAFSCTTLIGPKATVSQVKDSFKKSLATLDENDVLVCYFTGHAYMDRTAQFCLLPYDAPGDTLPSLSLRELAQEIRSARVGQTVLIFDTSFSQKAYSYFQ